MKTPKTVTGKALAEYVMPHLKPTPRSGIYEVVKPLHAFKKAYWKKPGEVRRRPAIVNLVIPAGELVHIDQWCFNGSFIDDRKMRASKAYVHSVAKAGGNTDALPEAVSCYDPSFKYRPGETVEPVRPFYKRSGTCASGIHFFVNLRDAYNY